jgi:hypothetical protein
VRGSSVLHKFNVRNELPEKPAVFLGEVTVEKMIDVAEAQSEEQNPWKEALFKD